MDSTLIAKLLEAKKRRGLSFEITVTGVSMVPTLVAGDVITVQPADDYAIGDILVFDFMGERLVHRLLQVNGGRYYCKGDNAFRLEDVTAEQVLGKVIAVNDTAIGACPARLVALSYAINRRFRKLGYDIDAIRATDIYGLYAKTILRGEDTMVYQKNTAMDFIEADATSMAVFDPESGDTHLLDEQGMDILAQLDEPADLDMILARLGELYDTTPAAMREDVETFLTQAVEKQIVLVL